MSKMNKSTRTIAALIMVCTSLSVGAIHPQWHISLKKPGNQAVTYQLQAVDGKLVAHQHLPVDITQTVTSDGPDTRISITLKANQTAYYNIGAQLSTGGATADADFYLPGFWYHKNLRSPKEAPSFHTSSSWNVREDRLSSPLSGVYHNREKKAVAVMRVIDTPCDVLTTHQEGEVILSGETSLGYVGFSNEADKSALTFGYPYIETPTRYIRKKTLTPSIYTFARLEKGQTKTISWIVRQSSEADYGQFVAKTWEWCFDVCRPAPLSSPMRGEEVKSHLANYFRKAYVDKYPLKYHSGHSIRIDDCIPSDHVQVGFCGRVLLNGFNALEYGEATGDSELVKMGQEIFASWLQYGFTAHGYFKEDMRIAKGIPADKDIVHSIREQSEAVYAVFHYLHYEKRHGRRHKEWEQKVRTLLNQMLLLQKSDGHFPRKYDDSHQDIDPSGGSTPSATSTLVMGYKYFGDKRYLEAAKRTVDYLEKNIIAPSDYFSSTLDANCEDKEAAISAVTATYYLALVTKNKERQHYIDLCRRACYFALSWYYLWDVPFAQGQMLGDLGFKSRGWGNVSVENNHIDVFVFELPHIMLWLADEVNEPRFSQMYDVISSSLPQLMPTADRHCGIAVPGFYPEVVQHTTWDYGRNGKGFYNTWFAPAWAVASLWELYSPTRTKLFF